MTAKERIRQAAGQISGGGQVSVPAQSSSMTAKEKIAQAAQTVKSGGTLNQPVQRKKTSDVFKPIMAQRAAESPTMALAVDRATHPKASQMILRESEKVNQQVKEAESTVRRDALKRDQAAGGYAAALGGVKRPTDTSPVASTYAAAHDAHQTGDQRETAEKAAEYGRLRDRQHELAEAYYFVENEEQRERISRDPAMQSKRQSVGDLQETIRMATAVAADAQNPGSGGEPGQIQLFKERLERDYGITPEALRNYALYGDDDSVPADGRYTNISQLIHQLEREQQGLADDMKKAGYDYNRMEGYQQRLKDAAEAKVRSEERKKAAREDPALASLGTVVANPLQFVDYAGATLTSIGGNDPSKPQSYVPIDTARMDTTNAVRTTRGEVAKMIEEDAGPVGSFLYQTGMSLADFRFLSGITGALSGGGKLASNLSLGIMGSSAAASETVDALNRGLSNRQALTLGAIAGVAEIVTEKVSLETLLDKTALDKSRLGYFLKNVIAEGSEEVASDLINWEADVLVSRDRSEWRRAIAAYEAQGMDENQAFFRALTDKAQEMGLDFAGGALSGGVMAGGQVAMDMHQDRATGRDWRSTVLNMDRETYQAFLDQGLESGEDTDAHRLAQRYQKTLDRKGTLSDGQLGRLWRANAAAIEAEGDMDTPEEENPAEGAKNASGSVIVRSSGISALEGQESLGKTLASSIDMLKDMNSVAQLTGQEMNDRSKKPSEQIRTFFSKVGSVFRKGFGEVSFGEYGVGGMLNHRPLNRAKMVTLEAVPSVIENGRVISDVDNWKGRGYRSVVFAAPVTVGDSAVYVAAVVNQNPEGKFYLSECVDSDGNYIRIEDNPSDGSKSGVTAQGGITATPEKSSSMGSIPQPTQDVNAKSDTVAARLQMMREHAKVGFGPSGETALVDVYDEKMAAEIDPAEAYGVFSRVYTAAMTGQEPMAVADAPETLVEAAKIAAKYDLRADLREQQTTQAPQQGPQVSRSPGFNYDDAATRQFAGTLSTEVETRMDAVARDLGLSIRAVDSVFGGKANAQISGGEILIDANMATNGVSYILGHEFTHRIQQLAGTEYSDFQNALDQEELRDTAAYLMELYQKQGVELTEAQALDEATANKAGEMLENGALLDEFIDRNRGNKTLLQRVREVFRAIIDKLTGAEKRRAQSAEGKLTAALKAATKNARTLENTQTEAEAGERYSIKFDDKGAIAVLEGKFDSDRKAVYTYLQGLVSDNALSTVLADAQEVYIGKDLPGEYTQSESTKQLFERVKKDKFRAAHVLDDMLLIGENVRWAEDKDGKHGKAAKNGWYYYTTRFATPVFNQDGTIRQYNRYSAQIVVRNDADGKSYLYDVTNIQRESSGIAADGFAEPTIVTRAPSDGNSVPHPGEDVNGNFSLKGTEHAERVVELERENAALQAKYEQARKQTRRSDAGKVSEAQVGRYAKMLMDHVGVKGDAKALGLKLQTMYDAVASGKDLDGVEFTYKDFRKMANDIAEDLVKNAVFVDNTLYDDYADLRGYVRSHTITVDGETRANITDYNDFRKRNMGRLRLAHGETGNIDQVYTEMSREWPGLFPEDVTNAQDQLERIAEVMEQVYARKEFNPWAGDMAGATQSFANEIMEQFWDLPGQEPTYADRQWRQREALKRRHMAEIQDAVRAEREKGKAREQKLKQWFKDKAAEQRAYKAESEARNRLLKLAARMKRMPVDNTNKTLIRELIGDLDTEARHLTGKKLTELTELRRYVEDMAASDPDFILDQRTADDLRRLEMKHIDDMTLQDVQDLTDALLNLENEIRTSKRLIGEQERRDIYQLGEQTVEDLRAVEGKKKRGAAAALDKLIVTETLSPLRQVRRMVGYKADSPLVKLTEGLADGNRKMLDYQMKAERPFERFAQDKNFTKNFSGKDAKTVKITGWVKGKLQEVEITPAMRVSLWLHSQNSQNLLHMRDGGVRVPDLTLYRKGKLADAYAAGTVVKLSPDMAKNLWNQMTHTERAFARETQKYFNDVSKNAINEVSNQLKGIDIATVENYFPIRTDKTFGKAELETLKFDGTIEGMGFLKERQNFAHNPMYLEDVNTVVEQAIRMHGKYVGLAIPVRNFGKVWNVSTAVQTEDGQWVSYGDSVQNAVQAVWGKAGYDYIAKMMTDLQGGGKQTDNLQKVLNKVRSNYAGAVLTLNASVAMKQAASYPTAAAVLGWGPLARAMGDVGHVDLDLIAKYTPLQWYRSQGFATKELGDIQNYGGVMKDVMSHKALNWIQGIDLATTRKLWKASEYYIRENSPQLTVGSEEYYRAVAEIYDRVIEETQPNYTTMQRPQLLRSDNTLLQNLVMFKTQPFQNFNILYDAAGEYRATVERAKAGDATKAEVKAAGRNLSRAVTSQVGQLAVFAAMSMAWGMFRGKKDKYEDDEGNVTLWSAIEGLGKDMLSGTASMVPFGTEVYEFASSKLFGERYYGMEPVAVESVANTATALSKLGDSIWSAAQSALKGEDVDWKSFLYQLDDSADDISKVAGMPYENVTNLFNAVARWALIGAKGKYLGEYAALHLTGSNEKNKQTYMDLLYDAMENDREAYNALWSQMVKDGWENKDIKNAMEKRMKDAQGVSKATELEERYVAPDDRTAYDEALERLANSALGAKATEEQLKAARADAYEFATRAGGESEQKKWDRWEEAGMDAGTYALYQLAKEMADEANNANGHIDNKEREAAIRSLAGLTDRERSALWLLANGSEKSNPWG